MATFHLYSVAKVRLSVHCRLGGGGFLRNTVFCSVLSKGVPRETEKEKEYSDFDIFDDPETPYSTFNFQYSNQAFSQLHDLMEFNTLNNLEVSGWSSSGWGGQTSPSG